MGSSLMRAPKPAQPAEPTEVPDMASHTNQIIETNVPSSQNVNDEVNQPVPSAPPDMGPSPTQDMSNADMVLDPPPGNWEIRQDDLYTQRQQVSSPPMVNLDSNRPQASVPKMTNIDDPAATSIPGAAPKARGPPLSISEARQPAVMITVPLPLRQRMNPHMPPPRINVPIPKMPYAMNPRGVGVPFPMTHAARVPHVQEIPQDVTSQRAFPPRRQVRTIRVPLRGPPPTPPIPTRQREDDVRFERSPVQCVYTGAWNCSQPISCRGAVFRGDAFLHNPP